LSELYKRLRSDPNWSDWLDRAWLLSCLLLATLWCVSASTRLSATFDEPNYVSNGLEVWRSGSYKLLMRQGTMPLPVDVISLPLHLWEKWRGTPFRIGSDVHSNPILLDDLQLLLPWARLGTLLFAWLLITYGWLMGRRLAGPWGGRLAAFMLAAEPSILAHATLATTDVAVSAAMLALVYHFERGRDQRWVKRVALPALWYGLAMLSKASALVFAPLCLVTIEVLRCMPKLRSHFTGLEVEVITGSSAAAREGSAHSPLSADSTLPGYSQGFSSPPWAQVRPGGFLAEHAPDRAMPTAQSRTASAMRTPGQWPLRILLQWGQRLRVEMRPFWRDLRHIILIALLITFVYVGSDWQTEPTFVKWADALGSDGWARTMQWVAHHLRIFTNAGEGLMQQIKHNVRGHGVFLLGWIHPRAVWYYFPVALSIKLIPPMLFTPVLLLALRPKALSNWAIVCGLVLLAFSVTYRVQIGIRLILPVVALLVVGLAAALVEAGQSLAGWKRQVTVATIALSMLWGAIAAVTVWPHGLCYTNELWGGTSRGYLRLSDSNYDWGQGLKDLDRWRRDRGLPALDLWHHGLDPAQDRPPFHSVPLQQVAVETPEDIGALLNSGYLAVGTTLLYGGWTRDPLQRNAAILRSLQPVGRTMTHFIYAFPPPPSP
jgi:hypothetical protein